MQVDRESLLIDGEIHTRPSPAYQIFYGILSYPLDENWSQNNRNGSTFFTPAAVFGLSQNAFHISQTTNNKWIRWKARIGVRSVCEAPSHLDKKRSTRATRRESVRVKELWAFGILDFRSRRSYKSSVVATSSRFSEATSSLALSVLSC